MFVVSSSTYKRLIRLRQDPGVGDGIVECNDENMNGEEDEIVVGIDGAAGIENVVGIGGVSDCSTDHENYESEIDWEDDSENEREDDVTIESEEENDVTVESDSDDEDVTMRRDLVNLVVERKFSVGDVNAILKFLKKNGHPNLPKRKETLMKTPREKVVGSTDCH